MAPTRPSTVPPSRFLYSCSHRFYALGPVFGLSDSPSGCYPIPTGLIYPPQRCPSDAVPHRRYPQAPGELFFTPTGYPHHDLWDRWPLGEGAPHGASGAVQRGSGRDSEIDTVPSSRKARRDGSGRQNGDVPANERVWTLRPRPRASPGVPRMGRRQDSSLRLGRRPAVGPDPG